jgi:hypothetical protein
MLIVIGAVSGKPSPNALSVGTDSAALAAHTSPPAAVIATEKIEQALPAATQNPTVSPNPTPSPTATHVPTPTPTPAATPSPKPAISLPPGSFLFNVSFVQAEITSDGRIGSEWTITVQVNGIMLLLGQSADLILKQSDKIVILCTATEQDKKPDVGKKTITLKVKDLEIGTKSITADVAVVENGGSHKGHKTVWKFTLSITRN